MTNATIADLKTRIYTPREQNPSTIPVIITNPDGSPMTDQAFRISVDYAISRSASQLRPTTPQGDYQEPDATAATAELDPCFEPQPGVASRDNMQIYVVYHSGHNAITKHQLNLPILMSGDSPQHAAIYYRPDLVAQTPQDEIFELIHMAFEQSADESRFTNYDEMKETQELLTTQCKRLAQTIKEAPEVAFMEALADHVSAFSTVLPWPDTTRSVVTHAGRISVTVKPHA